MNTIRYNITKIVLLLIVLQFINHESWCQQYSIDYGKLKKSGRIGLKNKVYQYKENKKDKDELKTFKKEKRAIRRDQRKHMKKIQTRATRKRMKKLYRSSVRVNKQKPAEYMHQRLYKKLTNDTKITYIKTKLFFETSFTNIKDLVSISNKKDQSKKQKFFEELY